MYVFSIYHILRTPTTTVMLIVRAKDLDLCLNCTMIFKDMSNVRYRRLPYGIVHFIAVLFAAA